MFYFQYHSSILPSLCFQKLNALPFLLLSCQFLCTLVSTCLLYKSPCLLCLHCKLLQRWGTQFSLINIGTLSSCFSLHNNHNYAYHWGYISLFTLPGRGKCSCGTCICDSSLSNRTDSFYRGSGCECPPAEDVCLNPADDVSIPQQEVSVWTFESQFFAYNYSTAFKLQLICSNHGRCLCDECFCDEDFSGDFCNISTVSIVGCPNVSSGKFHQKRLHKFQYTVEPLYSGHHWDSLKCPD